MVKMNRTLVLVAGAGCALGFVFGKRYAEARAVPREVTPEVAASVAYRELPGGGKYIAEYGRVVPFVEAQVPTPTEGYQGWGLYRTEPPSEYYSAKPPVELAEIASRRRPGGAETGSGEALGGF